MHALDHGAVLRGHQSGRLRAGDAERVHGLVGGEAQGGGRARRGGKHADGRAGMPALSDMLRAHAFADARADLVAGDGRTQEIAAAQAGAQLGDRKQRRQGDRADVQHALAVHVVELEALNERAVDQRGMRRRQPLRRSPDAAGFGGVELAERLPQDAAPFEVGAVERAAERIQDQQFDARDDVSRNVFVFDAGNELRDGAGMRIVA